MSEYRELFDRAALDPDSAFVAELEGQLTGPAAGFAAARADRLADRGLRSGAVIVLAAAAAIAAVAIFLTSGGDSNVGTVPGTEPSVASLPAGLSPASVSFVSPTKGWLLGSCGRDATCPGVGLATTDDRGQDWRAVNGPPVPFGEGDVGSVRSIRFANDRDGYVFGGDLWVTHDGAATWQRVLLPGADGSSTVVAVETGGGTTYAVFTTGEGFRIASSPAMNDGWQLDPLVIPYGAGPARSIQLVLHGSAGYLLVNDRVAIAGARLGGNGRWYEEWTALGADVGGPALLAASGETDIAMLISAGIWGGPSTPATLFARSTDAGQGFRIEGPEVPIAPGSAAAMARPRYNAAVVAGADQRGAPVLVATFDGGQTWSTVWTGSGAARWTDLGFITLDQGVVVLGHDDGTADLLMTLDGGHTWSAAG